MLIDTKPFSNRLLIMISTLQGGLLLGLYRLQEAKVWSDGTEIYSLPLWAAALVFPLMSLLALEKGNARSLLRYIVAYTVLVMLLAAYLGGQLPPNDSYQGGTLIRVFTLAMVVATFKAIMYIQQHASSLPFTYSVFFSLSWRNFLVTSLALLFMAVVALLLLLWRSLFSAIGIEFFYYLFQRDWFLFPVLTLLSLSFLTSLLFVGLDVLWSTNVGTALMLWLLASLLFLVNAVYQDGRGDTAYSSGMHRFISVGLITLPVLSGLALYGLSLRIGQHGFTVARLYGLTVWLALSAFAVCYLWALVKQREQWTVLLGPINIRIGLGLLVTVLLISSPIIDFRKITLANQLARFESGEVKIDDLDVRYFRQDLGAPGHDAYETLVGKFEAIHPELVADWKLDYTHPARQMQVVDLDRWLVKHPATLELPDDVKTLLQRLVQIPDGVGFQAVIFQQDLDGDSIDEFVVLSQGGRRFNQYTAYYFQRQNGEWQLGQLVSSEPIDYLVLLAQVQQGEMKLVRPEYSDLEIGGIRFRVQSLTNTLSGGLFMINGGAIRLEGSPLASPLASP